MLQPATLDVVTLDPIPQPDERAPLEALRSGPGYVVAIDTAATTLAVTRGSVAR